MDNPGGENLAHPLPTAGARRSRARYALFCLSPILATLLALEVGLRILAVEPVAQHTAESSYIQYDPLLGWRHIPNTRTLAQLPGIPVHFEVTINSQGWRDLKDYPLKKPPGDTRVRVLALGDSFTFGHAVATAQSWPFQLEQADGGLEVFNLGVQAYGLDQMTLLYESVSGIYEADLVVVALIPDDLRRVYSDRWVSGAFRPQFRLGDEGEAVQKNGDVPPPGEKGELILSPRVDGWLARHSRLARYVRASWRGWRTREDHFRLPAAILRRLLGDIRRNGQASLVVLLADRESLRGNEDAIRVAEIVRRECADAGAGFLGALPAFQAVAKQGAAAVDSLFEPGGHYSAQGNAFVARRIADLIHSLPTQAASYPSD